MKRAGLSLILFGLGIICAYSQDSIVPIPDNNFLWALIEEGVDINGDSMISHEEAEAIISLDIHTESDWICGHDSCWREGVIRNLAGIDAFINLDSLSLTGNEIDLLDLTHNSALKYLDCRENQLKHIDISNNALLQYLDCQENELKNFDVSSNTLLEYLNCGGGHEIRELDFTQNKALKYLDVNGCRWGGMMFVPMPGYLNSLNISECSELEYLDCSWNKLECLDLSNQPKLRFLDCGNNLLDNIDLSKNLLLENLYCSWNSINSLELNGQPLLNHLECGNNQLDYLDISNNLLLESLRFSGNQISCMDISENKALKSLHIGEDSVLSEVCVFELPFPPDGFDFHIWDSPYVYFTETCMKCNDTLAYIPDEAFLFALIESGIDINGDSLISRWEAELVTTLNVSNTGIRDLSGIEHFTRLISLDVGHNRLTRLNVTGNIELVSLNCSQNLLSSLDIAKNSELTYLNCEGNLLGTLNIAQNKLLDTLMIAEMPRLTEVCTWSDSFPPEGLIVESYNSPNAYFTYLCECDGDHLEENDRADEPAFIETDRKYTDLYVSAIDDDWYVFHISNYFTDANIHFEVKQFNGNIQADLWNDYPYPWGNPGNPILSLPISGENDLLGLILRPGEYWLRISSDSGSVTEYSLLVDALSYPEIFYEPSSLLLADISIYSNQRRKLTIYNQGTLELCIDSIHNSLIGSRVIPATAVIPPGEKLDITLEIIPRTLGEFHGDLTIFTNHPSYEYLTIPVSGNGYLSQSVVILKEIIDTISVGYWKAIGLKFPNNSADFYLRLLQSAITYSVPGDSHDNFFQPENKLGTWVYTTLEDTTMIAPKENTNFWFVLDATDLQKGDYYADVVFEWYNPNYFRGFIPVQLHVRDTVVSVSPKSSFDNLRIYPNPTGGPFTILTPAEDQYEILIYTINGHLVYHSSFFGKSYEFDLSSFKKGIYFIAIRTKGFVTTRKIIKL